MVAGFKAVHISECTMTEDDSMFTLEVLRGMKFAELDLQPLFGS